MKKIFSAMLMIVLLAGSSPASAQKPQTGQLSEFTEDGTLEPLTQFDRWWPWQMVSDGRYAYINSLYGPEVIVLDTIDPAHPIKIASIPMTPDDTTLAAANNILYVGRYFNGIFIYNVSNPTNPGLIGQFEPIDGMSPIQMVISGSLAYLADFSMGLTVLDISDPAHPALIGFNDEEDIRQLAVQGNYAYALARNGLVIFDISNPELPILVGHYENSTRPSGVTFTVIGNYAYIPGSIDHYPDPPEFFTDVIDVSNPAEPKRVTDLPELAGPVRQLTAIDGFLYAVGDGLAIFNTTDPLHPQLMGVFPSYLGAGVSPQEDRALYLDFYYGFYVLDTTDPAHPTQTGFYTPPQSARYLTSIGTDVYSVESIQNSSTDYKSILRVIDAEDPFDPQVSGYCILDGETLGKPFVDGSFVYVPTVWGVEIINASNPATMQVVARTGSRFSFVVEVQDNVAYTLSQDIGSGGILSIIDVSNPVLPTLLSQSPVYYTTGDMSIEQQGDHTYAYLLTDGQLIILDVTDSLNPFEVQRNPLYEEYSLIDTERQGSQTIAYLSGRNSFFQDAGIIAMDVSDPAHPVFLGAYPIYLIDQAVVLEARDGIVYFSDYSSQTSGLRFFDFTDPAHPYQFANALDPNSSIHDASVGSEYIYTTPNGGQIAVFQKISDITGRVTDHNSKPVSGVTLTLNTGAETLTDEDGSYRFPNLDSGRYIVTPTLGTFAFSPPHREVNIPSDWVSQNFVILPHPVSAVLEPGIATTLTYTDVQGLPTSFIFPAGLVSTTASAHVTPTLASGFFGTDFAGHAFHLAIDTGQLDIPDDIFTRPISVTIQYSLDDTAVISDTTSLALYRYNGSGWDEAEAGCPITGATPIQEPGGFHGRLCQEGLFALLGPAYNIALPLLSFGGGEAVCQPPGCPPISFSLEE